MGTNRLHEQTLLERRVGLYYRPLLISESTDPVGSVLHCGLINHTKLWSHTHATRVSRSGVAYALIVPIFLVSPFFTTLRWYRTLSLVLSKVFCLSYLLCFFIYSFIYFTFIPFFPPFFFFFFFFIDFPLFIVFFPQEITDLCWISVKFYERIYNHVVHNVQGSTPASVACKWTSSFTCSINTESIMFVTETVCLI